MFGAYKSIPELRTTEFKGLLRFWWRAVKASDNLEHLKEEENKIFGGISGTKGIKSAVKLSSSGGFVKCKTGINLQSELGDSRFGQNDMSSIKYLLYSVIKDLKYLKPNSHFDLTITSRDEHAFQNAVAALWAFIYFGGVGTRARRGGGNLYVEKIQGEGCELQFIPQANSSKELAAWLKGNFQKVQEIISPSSDFCTSYSNLNFSRFVISSGDFIDWKKAMADVGEEYKKFRGKHKDRIISGSLGLPIVHGIRNNNITKVIAKKIQENHKQSQKNNQNQENQEVFKRRASPLIIKILKSHDKYYWLALRLSGEFLPQGAQLVWDGKKQDQNQNNNQKGKTYTTAPPSYEILDDFWTDLKKDNLEYILSLPKNLIKIKEEIISNLNLAPQELRKIIIYGPWARGDAHTGDGINLGIDAGQPLDKITLNFNLPKVVLSDLITKEASYKEKIQNDAVEL